MTEMPWKKPELGREILHEDVRYITTDDEPKSGDLVLTDKYGVWTYRPAPCPMPYWGNPAACRVMKLKE